MSNWKLFVGEVIEGKILLLSFDRYWDQDDIKQLKNHIITSLKTAEIIEVITGADRENTRFIWNKLNFMLNFECYSQSCWIEAEPPVKLDLLLTLQRALKNT